METVIEINATKEALMAALREIYKFGEMPTEIKIEHYGFDGRIDWDTFIVTSPQGVIGFTDGELDEDKPQHQKTNSGNQVRNE